jgi:deoxyribodipyrimidine photo-lyase
MHNRLRMMSASFLVKHLGIDWRRGEHHFALAARLRPRREQRRLAVVRIDRLRRAAVVPHLQSGGLIAPLRRAGRVHSPLASRARRRPPALIHAPWRVTSRAQRAARCIIGRDYPPPIVDHGQARGATLPRYSAVASR